MNDSSNNNINRTREGLDDHVNACKLHGQLLFHEATLAQEAVDLSPLGLDVWFGFGLCFLMLELQGVRDFSSVALQLAE